MDVHFLVLHTQAVVERDRIDDLPVIHWTLDRRHPSHTVGCCSKEIDGVKIAPVSRTRKMVDTMARVSLALMIPARYWAIVDEPP